MPTVKLSSTYVTKAPIPTDKEREFYWDAALPGFGLMITANGARSYVVQYRANGTSRRMSISGSRPLAQAKRDAKGILGAVAKGGDPLMDKRQARKAKGGTLRRIVEDEYLADREVKKLRSINEKRGTFERYIFPTLGSRPLAEIKRSEIRNMLDKVKRNNGPGAANNAVKVLSSFYNWYVPKADDNFSNPIVRGTYKQTKGDGARTLSDDEIRILWNVAAEGRSPYDHFLQFILLTATRRNEAARMLREELSADAMEWTIPEARYKGEDGKSAHAHLIPLSPQARDVLARLKVLQVNGKDSPWVFTTNGTTPISGFSKYKKAFTDRLFEALDKADPGPRKRIISDLNNRYPGKGYQPFDGKWRTHSLRKTARTLLDRLGVSESIAEKCLGHIKGGIVGTYNHHEAKPEKRAAFEALGREVERIATGKIGNVIPLSAARA
jgi:integrase